MTTTSQNASGMGTEHSTPASVASSAVPVDYSDVHGGAEKYDAHHSTSKIRSELLNLKSDLDTLMSRASSLSDTELHDARDKMMAKFGAMQQSAKNMASRASQRAADARQQLNQRASDAKVQLNQGVDVTTQYIQERPLQSVAIAAGVGFLLGALLRRD